MEWSTVCHVTSASTPSARSDVMELDVVNAAAEAALILLPAVALVGMPHLVGLTVVFDLQCACVWQAPAGLL
jgi:hypothetical protein